MKRITKRRQKPRRPSWRRRSNSAYFAPHHSGPSLSARRLVYNACIAQNALVTVLAGLGRRTALAANVSDVRDEQRPSAQAAAHKSRRQRSTF